MEYRTKRQAPECSLALLGPKGKEFTLMGFEVNGQSRNGGAYGEKKSDNNGKSVSTKVEFDPATPAEVLLENFDRI